MSNVEKILRVALSVPMDNPSSAMCRWGAPVLLWGPPGIGKTGRVEQAGAECDLPLETVYLSTHQPEDLSGIPMNDNLGGVTMVCSLPQVHALVANKRGILFLDELSCARPAVQAAGLAVVYERVIAGRRLPGGIRVLAAANPPEDAAGGWALPAPMANRFMHIDVPPPSSSEWVEWLLETGEMTNDSAEANEQLITEAWSEAWAYTRGIGAGFMRSAGDKLYKLPPVGHKERGRAWASHRSWVMMLRVLATCRILGENALAIELIEGTVGAGVAAEWVEWTTKANLPSPEEILEKGWKPNKRRLDVAIAAYSSATAFALSKPKPEQRKWAVLLWKALSAAVLEYDMADVAQPSVVKLMKAGYNTKSGEDINDVSREAIKRLGAGVAMYSTREE